MRSVKIYLQRESGTEDLPLPRYMTAGASGMDLVSAASQDVVIDPGQSKLISTGMRVAIPEGFEAQIRPRSGLALKHNVTVLNTPGTIDSDYRGIVSLIMVNLGKQGFTVTRGMRLAQMVIQEVIRAEIEVIPRLDLTERAHGGFGHTGQ